MTIGLLTAAAGAVLYGIGSVLQAVGVRQSSGRGRGIVGAALQVTYLAGLGCDLAAWAISLVALRRLPVFVVQAMLAASLAVTALLAAATVGTALTRIDWYAIVAVVASLAVIARFGAAEGRRQPRRRSRLDCSPQPLSPRSRLRRPAGGRTRRWWPGWQGWPTGAPHLPLGSCRRPAT